MWLHLDGEAITEARHCVICQPHGHVIDAACADCGDGPLITGQPPRPRRPPRRAGAELATPARLANLSRPAMPRSRPLITDRALVCGW